MRQLRVITATLILISSLLSGHTEAKGRIASAFHYKDKAIVLIYHAFEPVEKDITITPERLNSHLQALRDNGYHFISMDDFVRFKENRKKLPNNAVLVTIDDGYESVYTRAYPILRNNGASAATFVVVQSTDKPMQNGEQYPHLSWEQMKAMAATGMSFYSHTYALHGKVKTDVQGHLKPSLTTRIFNPETKTAETDESYQSRIKSDLHLADQRLTDELGNQVNLLAFPFGSYTDEAIQVGRAEGIKLFFTTKPGINRNDSSDLVQRINAGTAGTSAERLLSKLRPYDERMTPS